MELLQHAASIGELLLAIWGVAAGVGLLILAFGDKGEGRHR